MGKLARFQRAFDSTFSIITTEANELIAPIHDRMPVILKQEYENDWLNTAIDDKDYLKSMLQPYDPDLIDLHTVSTLVNSPKNNHKELLLPL